MTTCPHCARTFARASDRTLHARACPEHPNVAAWLARNLPDPARPGWIVTRVQYDMLDDKPITASGLIRWGGNWSDVAARFGLRCHERPAGAWQDPAQTRTWRVRANWTNLAVSLERGDEPISREYTGLPVMLPPRVLPDGRLAWEVR